MKKIFSFLAAAAMLFAASCTKDNVGTDNGNDTQVTFNLSLEGQSGTRAIGDGSGVTKLSYYIFDVKTGERLNHYDYENQTFSTVTPKIQLAKDQKYKAVFWAQKETDAYTIEKADDKSTVNIKVNYAKNANDEARDAFYGVVEFTVTGSERIDVLLTRPFAQLNVGVTAKDYQDAEHSGVVITKSWAKVSGVYNTLNLLDGSVSNVDFNGVATFAMAATPKAANASETLKVEETSYEYLSMNYVLVGAKENVAAEFEFATDSYVDKDNKGKTIAFNSGLSVVPVQRNYRTNLVGQILTGNLDFNVSIDKNFKDEYNPTNTPSTEEELRVAVASGVGEITLQENITLTQPLVIENTGTRAGITPIVINLNGKTITTELKSEGRHHYAIDNYGDLVLEGEGAINARGIQNFGTMTINGNITITNIDTNGGSAIWNEGNLTINGGTFKTTTEAGEGSYGAALNTRSTGSAVVNGGTFEAYSQLTYAIVNEGETVINNATVKGKHGAVAGEGSKSTIINGGSFELMENPGVSDHCLYYVSTVKGGTFTLGANTDSGAQVFYESTIAQGYKAVAKDGKYYVVAEQVDAVVGNVTELKDALANGDEVYLAAGEYTLPSSSIKEGQTIICEEGTVFTGKSSLNIKGATIIGATFEGADNQVVNSSTINGIFKNCKFVGDLKYCYAGENVVFENCEFNGPDYALHFDGGANSVTLKNCVINSEWRVAIGAAVTLFKAENCKFNVEGFVNVYCNSIFTNCEFNTPRVSPLGGKLEFNNCKYNDSNLVFENLKTYNGYNCIVCVNGTQYEVK